MKTVILILVFLHPFVIFGQEVDSEKVREEQQSLLEIEKILIDDVEAAALKYFRSLLINSKRNLDVVKVVTVGSVVEASFEEQFAEGGSLVTTEKGKKIIYCDGLGEFCSVEKIEVIQREKIEIVLKRLSLAISDSRQFSTLGFNVKYVILGYDKGVERLRFSLDHQRKKIVLKINRIGAVSFDLENPLIIE
jgi:hypothetical protein